MDGRVVSLLFSIQLRGVARSSTWQGIVVDVCVTVGGVGRGVEGEGGKKDREPSLSHGHARFFIIIV